MRYIIVSILFASSLLANTISVPEWVPERKRVAWIEYVNSVNDALDASENLKKHSREYQKVLASVPKVIECKKTGDETLRVVSVRHVMKTILTVRYTKEVESCEIIDNVPTVRFKRPGAASKTWGRIKEIASYAGAVVLGGLVGYAIGKLSG